MKDTLVPCQRKQERKPEMKNKNIQFDKYSLKKRIRNMDQPNKRMINNNNNNNKKKTLQTKDISDNALDQMFLTGCF